MHWSWITAAAATGGIAGAVAMGAYSSVDEKFASFHISEVLAEQRTQQRAYHEFLRKDSMRCAVYTLPRGAMDRQTPHEVDEIYFVLDGKATLRVGTGDGIEDTPCRKGSVLFIGAGVEHRFVNIEQDLEMLVVFAEKPAALPNR